MNKIALFLIINLLSFTMTNYAQTLDDAFDITSSGIIAQKFRINIIAQNVANASTLRDEATGLPYQKRYVVLRPTEKGVQIESVEKSTEPFQKYFDPASPESDANGFFYYPNINLPQEIQNMRFSELLYEANVSVFKSTKTMYQQAIELMK